MDLYYEIELLKSSLVEYYTNDTGYAGYPSIDEMFPGYDNLKIHKIEESLKYINSDSTTQLLTIVKDATCLGEIYDEISYNNFNYNIKKTFNPILKFLVSKNYSVVVTEVKLVEESKILEINHIRRHINEMEEAYKNKNFGTVNVISSSVIQSLYKEICVQSNVKPKKGMNDLTEQVLLILNMVEKEKEPILKDFITNIENLVRTLNKLRNLYSTGHGTSNVTMESYNNIGEHHYYFIMDTTKTLCNFFIGSYNLQNKDSGELEI